MTPTVDLDATAIAIRLAAAIAAGCGDRQSIAS
jgi:hypothetical protein